MAICGHRHKVTEMIAGSPPTPHEQEMTPQAPHGQEMTPQTPQAPQAPQAPPVPRYTPSQIRTAYGINTVQATGLGTKIAIVDAFAYPKAQADFDVFCQTFSLPPLKLEIVNLATKPDAGWALEQALDVQWAHAVAPGAQIMLVQAESASVAHLLSAVDYAIAHGATVVSLSWGSPEFATETKLDPHFNTSKNVVILASSGDFGDDIWPSTSPHVVSVGGTTLRLNANNTRFSETGWSGSGGGVSRYEPIPEFQRTGVFKVGGTHRKTPDVAMLADPATGVWVYNTNPDTGLASWSILGGTSLSAPCWAGIVAVANELRSHAGKPPLSTRQLLTGLYRIPRALVTTKPVGFLYDETTGTALGKSATTGYDLVTGLGSPNTNRLIPNWLAKL